MSVSLAVKAPRWPSVAAAGTAGLAVAAAVIGLVTDPALQFRGAIVGYVLGAVVVTVLVEVHRIRRNDARRREWFSPSHGLDRLAHAALTAGLGSAAWHAFVVATELAK